VASSTTQITNPNRPSRSLVASASTAILPATIVSLVRVERPAVNSWTLSRYRIICSSAAGDRGSTSAMRAELADAAAALAG